MFKLFRSSEIPSVLHGPLLVEHSGLPRFWVTVWSLYAAADLAESSQSKQLRHIENLYQFADDLKSQGSLDDAIG